QHQAPSILGSKSLESHYLMIIGNKYYGWFIPLQSVRGMASYNVEVKPYVLDDQMCDECQGARCGGKFAPFFCANVTCLQYYCEYCWASIHSRAGREFHKPLVKEGGDRPRHVSFRWS
ncbi:unnamed protein product, partial [Pleuronectes platessa]